MESGEFIPAGPPEAGAEAQMLEAHNTWVPFALPVIFTAATWAVDRFTKSAIGDWRYIPVVLFGACAVYFAVLAVVATAALQRAKPGGRRMPRWSARTTNVLFAALVVVAVVVEIIRAVRYHSVIDAVSVLVIVVWAGLIALSARTATGSRGRRRTYSAGVPLLSLWFLVVAVFHLR